MVKKTMSGSRKPERHFDKKDAPICPNCKTSTLDLRDPINGQFFACTACLVGNGDEAYERLRKACAEDRWYRDMMEEWSREVWDLGEKEIL